MTGQLVRADRRRGQGMERSPRNDPGATGQLPRRPEQVDPKDQSPPLREQEPASPFEHLRRAPCPLILPTGNGIHPLIIEKIEKIQKMLQSYAGKRSALKAEKHRKELTP